MPETLSTFPITHRTVDVNGVSLHLAEAGPADGPVVLLLHGFPESWYSWRHQLRALAEAGYRVIAPDQRGYGGSEAPQDAAAYTMLHLVGDVVGVLDAVGAEQAVVVGHDWGAPVAWHTALLRPDRVRGVAALSVPYLQRTPVPPTQGIEARFGPDHYMLYFQQPGVADAELAADPRATFRRLLTASSGSGQQQPPRAGAGFVDALPEPAELPAWLTEADLDAYVEAYATNGFTGGLNWYRNIDRNWELTAPWQGASITPPALFLAGEHDLVLAGTPVDAVAATLRRSLTDLRHVELLPDTGHWTQQERPDEVNAALLGFLAELDGPRT